LKLPWIRYKSIRSAVEKQHPAKQGLKPYLYLFLQPKDLLKNSIQQNKD